MPAFAVSESIDISASVEQTRAALIDYQEWPKWSPWLCAEPDAALEFRGSAGEIGHGYNWDGKVVGAGGMDLTGVKPDSLIMDLNFLRPFKSSAKVDFSLQAVSDSSTRVTWAMDSKLPFFMFFWVDMFKKMIGNDYQRGLKLLKQYIETGDTQCKIEVVGVEEVTSIRYAGLNSDSTLEKLGEVTESMLPAIHQKVQAGGIPIEGPPLNIYHKFNMKTHACNLSVAVPIAEGAQIDTVECQAGETGTGKALKVKFFGDYQHLGNAWSAGMMHQKALKLKTDKNRAPYEVYVGDPAKESGKDCLTEIYLPVR